MSWMKNFKDHVLTASIVCFYLIGALIVVETAYHHYLEEHARPVSKGWQPPKIVRHENCSTWDEIRKECEDD